jgi:hypothetical protein
MRHYDWRSLVAFTAASLVLSACSGSSPLSPDQAATPGSTAAKSSPPEPTFPLLAGALTITTREGTVTGTYTGEARPSGGVFTLSITGGTGAFAAGSGILRGSGQGGFIGEGKFSHVLDGELWTTAGSRRVKIGIKGTAILSCVNEAVIVNLTGSGHLTRYGQITAIARHQIGNASCSSD